MKTIVQKILEVDLHSKVLVSRYDGLREWINATEFINEINRLIEDYEFRDNMQCKDIALLKKELAQARKELKEINDAYEGNDI